MYARDGLSTKDIDMSNKHLQKRETLIMHRPVNNSKFITEKVESILRAGLKNNGDCTIVLDGLTSSGKSTLVSNIINTCAAVTKDECQIPTCATAMTIKTSIVVPSPSHTSRRPKTFVITKNGTRNELIAKEEDPNSEEGCFVKNVKSYLGKTEKAMEKIGIMVSRQSRANQKSSRAITVYEVVMCKHDGMKETCVTLNLVDPPGHENRNDNDRIDIHESADVQEL